jgi:hypothetical protein
MTGGVEKKLIVPVAHRKDAQQKIFDPDAMHGLLFIAALAASHEEVSPRDVGTRRLCGKFRQSILTPDF